MALAVFMAVATVVVVPVPTAVAMAVAMAVHMAVAVAGRGCVECAIDVERELAVDHDALPGGVPVGHHPSRAAGS